MRVGQKIKLLTMRLFCMLKMDYTVECPEAKEDKLLKKIIYRSALAALASENICRRCYISVTICTPAHIRELNLAYREKDSETDVLSFPLWEADERPARGVLELGDIVISLDRAKEQGQELGHSLYREVAFLTGQSTLHLLGYDHERSPEEDEDMCRRQSAVVTYLHMD